MCLFFFSLSKILSINYVRRQSDNRNISIIYIVFVSQVCRWKLAKIEMNNKMRTASVFLLNRPCDSYFTNMMLILKDMPRLFSLNKRIAERQWCFQQRPWTRNGNKKCTLSYSVFSDPTIPSSSSLVAIRLATCLITGPVLYACKPRVLANEDRERE